MESHRKEVEEQSTKQWSLAAVFADGPVVISDRHIAEQEAATMKRIHERNKTIASKKKEGEHEEETRKEWHEL